MPCHTRTNPLQTIQPPHKSVAHLTTPVKKSAKRSKRSDTTQHLDLAPRDDNDGVEPTSIHSVPTELLSAVLSLSEDTCENDVEAQRQCFTNAAVCKAWKLLTVGPGASDEFAIRGFKTARRCMRVFSSSEPETSKRADEARRVSVDLMRDERVGTNQMVADLISACDNLRELTLLFLGRDRGSPDAACLTVPIYDSFSSRPHLVELKLYFRRVWTTLTLGGDLSRSLNKLTSLKRLHLPAIQVPRVDPTFPFSPTLTHLSLHLTDDSSLLLLAHLIDSSTLSLLHLHLTIHPNAILTTLPSLLAPVANQLLSFGLDAYSALSTDAQTSGVPFHSILSQMHHLSSLTLSDYLSPDSLKTPLDVASSLPRLRHLSVRLCDELALSNLTQLVVDAGEGLRLTTLEILPSPDWREVVEFLHAGEGRDLKELLEERGINVYGVARDGPQPEDDEEADDE